ncbi:MULTISPECIES: hypothetical protein [Methylomonas]|uniref:hypothetical protein n=1 Tax=Methylomonas TaxID=416 RepID=UPI0007C8CA45|nr:MULTISPECIES: hypothetical protein [Methylomonas]ANE54765.1 hypothetical protein AYM39_05925 [Methylomonas sp. DH-1]WNB74851.1 hypothetical protein RI210_16400 [Methylomonas koyamae]
MNSLSTAEQDFLAKKTELQAAQADEANKRREVATLRQRQHDLQTELAALNQRLAQASNALANGDMTSADYIALKRSIADKELECEAASAVFEAQNNALQMLVDHARILAGRLGRHLTDAAAGVKQRALAASVATGEAHLKLFALAVAAQHLERHPYTGQEKSEQAQLAYRIIGEELCKAVFADENEAWLVMVEPSRARIAIEETIEQAA